MAGADARRPGFAASGTVSSLDTVFRKGTASLPVLIRVEDVVLDENQCSHGDDPASKERIPMKQHPKKILMITVTCLMVTFLYGAKKAPVTQAEQLNFGVKMAQRGLWSEALFRFRQAERLQPGDSRVLNNMAVAYEALGNFEKALDFYQNAIKSDPTNKDLKRNYSRFVEFYRAFKPAEKEKEEETGGGSVIRPAGP